jgi:hypothetical protein
VLLNFTDLGLELLFNLSALTVKFLDFLNFALVALEGLGHGEVIVPQVPVLFA